MTSLVNNLRLTSIPGSLNDNSSHLEESDEIKR